MGWIDAARRASEMHADRVWVSLSHSDHAAVAVVVLEQGAWASYGHEEAANKDELLNRFPADDQMLLSDECIAEIHV